jgi:3-oxoacyl-[acyl-carrier-protein] synthase-3
MAVNRRYAHIVGWGKYVPSKVLTNDDLAKMVDTSDEWIRTRTGIVQRYIADVKDTTSSMAIRAAQDAIAVAGCSPDDIDLIIVATATPDYMFPATACLVQDAIGASRAGAFDLSAGCSGFIYALSMASHSIRSGAMDTILVIGSEALSRIVDWTDRATCVLFGDGAGAVILQASERPGGVLSTVLGSDGSGGNLLILPGGGSRYPASAETVAQRLHCIKMDGNEVYRFATRIMGKAAQQATEKAGLTLDDIELFIPHQANIRIIQSAAKHLKLSDGKVFTNVDRYGNTSSASIPIALCEAIAAGQVHPHDHLVFVGFGAGLTWGAAVVQWVAPPVPKRRPWYLELLIRLRLLLAGPRSQAKRVSRHVDTLVGEVTGEVKEKEIRKKGL